MPNKKRAVSIPLLVLRECKGETVTVELSNGETYEGQVGSAESTMSLYLTQVTKRAQDGRISRLQQVYIRGNQVVLVRLPSILHNFPLLQRIEENAGQPTTTV
jgi:small nuclear ribonucleoprotein D3